MQTITLEITNENALKVLQDLQAYATKKGIATPTAETNEAIDDLTDLAQEDQKDFDRKWCDELRANHKKRIRKFESRINQTKDVELKNLLSVILPSLKIHLDMIEKEYDRLK